MNGHHEMGGWKACHPGAAIGDDEGEMYRPVDVEILKDGVEEKVKEEHELEVDAGLPNGSV